MLKFEVWLYGPVNKGQEGVIASSMVLATDPVSALQVVLAQGIQDGLYPNDPTRIEIVKVIA